MRVRSHRAPGDPGPIPPRFKRENHPADSVGVDDRLTWGNTWRYVTGVAGCLAIGFYPFVFEKRVPLLGLADLGFHELGHLLTYSLPDPATAMAGSAMQVLVPLTLAAYFLLRAHRDLLATGLCLAWAGSAAADVAVYVADAPYEALPLIGGHHDWAFILGRLGALDAAGGIAAWIRGAGGLLVLAGLAACLAGGLVRHRKDEAVPVIP
jgi:hypothetical protein